ncbi:MAG: hypothetical protein ACLUFN_10565 [Eubacterium sp.]
MNNIKNFEIKDTLNRIINELDIKIEETIKPKSYEKRKPHKADFLNNLRLMENFPFTKQTYYSYSSFVKAERTSRKNKGMKVESLYSVCNYTGVSADYFLGFKDTKRQEPSAERVRQDFGLSDKAMENLSKINNLKPESKGELSSNLVNMVLENYDFWEILGEKLSVYLSCLNNSRAEIDAEVSRYGLSRVFEDLIDNLCNQPFDNLPSDNKLDYTGAFPQKK